MKGKRSAARRSVYINGVYYESMSAGARQASKLINKKVHVSDIQRVLKGVKQIPKLDISEVSPTQRKAKQR